MKREPSRIKSDILLRVRLLYVLFILIGATVLVRLVWVQAFSKIFPFTFYTDIFIDQALRGAPVVDSLWDMGYIALFIVLPMLCLPRLRKICSDEKYWGRM